MWPRCLSCRRRAAARALALQVAAACAVAPLAAQSVPGHRELWGDEVPLVFRLSFDRKTVYADRDTLSTKTYPATLTWTDSAGTPHHVPVGLRTRGHFRLATRNCDTPPLRLLFDKADVKGTPFRGQKRLKLVNACRQGSRYDEFIRREHAVYRVHNLITDWSFRSRLATVTYADTSGAGAPVTRTAMLLEDEDEVARRHGATVWKKGRARMVDAEPGLMALSALFEYFAANVDWSVPAQHNFRIFEVEQDVLYPVPYDFDWSGLVDAPYAFPDPRLKIKSVRERLYRGPCRTPEAMAPLFQRFRDQRTAIEDVYATAPGLSPDYVARTRAYIAEFYRTIDDPGRWKAEMERGCMEDRP